MHSAPVCYRLQSYVSVHENGVSLAFDCDESQQRRITHRGLPMIEDEISDYEAVALGFDDPEEETSPEHGRRSHSMGDVVDDPCAVVASPSPERRSFIAALLRGAGWTVIDVRSLEELYETIHVVAPEIFLIDPALDATERENSIPEEIERRRPGHRRRTLAILDNVSGESLSKAVAAGYDDYILDPDNEMEITVRATSNLRDCRLQMELDEKRQNANSLFELSQTLASSLDMQLILHMVSRLISDVMNVERCSIIILDPEHEDALMVAASEDSSVRDIRIELSDYPELKTCVRKAEPVIIQDARADPLFKNASNTNRGPDDDVRLMALFPIIFEERVNGVLFLRSHHIARKLTEHEMQFGRTVASACAVAIRNARLFDSFRDQTERINYMRLAAEKQMEALRKYEDFFEYAADGMAIVDLDATILYVNREGRTLMGNTAHHFRGDNFLDSVVERSRGDWTAMVGEVRHGRFKNEMDFAVRRGDGEERIFSVSAGGVGQETGLIVLSFRDVTETREMGVELRTTKDFLENLIDNSVDAIIAADMSGNLMLFNKGAEHIYGFSADDVIGKMHISQLYPPRVAMEVMRQLRDERWGGAGRLEAQRKFIRDCDGDFVPVSMTASIIYEEGEEVATVGVFTDLRDRLQMESDLSTAQEELMRSEKARVAAELAGMAAHELNQPLTSVLGYAEMLQHRIPSNQTKIRRHVDTIFKQAERMAEIVRRIGQITKYETTSYTGHTRILSLEGSAPEDEAAEKGESNYRARAITNASGHKIPTRQGEEQPPARSKSVGDLTGMLGRPAPKRTSLESVVRMDTIDEADRVRLERAANKDESDQTNGDAQPASAGSFRKRLPTLNIKAPVIIGELHEPSDEAG